MGFLDLGTEKPVIINGNIVLDGMLNIITIIKNEQITDKRGVLIYRFNGLCTYSYLVEYTAITDIKEASHEL